MVSVGQRLIQGAVSATLFAPILATAGAINGYIYAKLADLPAKQAAKAYAVYALAGGTLSILVEALFQNPTHKVWASVTTGILCASIGISELRKRGLMGDKYMYVTIAVQSLFTIGKISQHYFG